MPVEAAHGSGGPDLLINQSSQALLARWFGLGMLRNGIVESLEAEGMLACEQGLRLRPSCGDIVALADIITEEFATALVASL
eukprot:CAMPEP_0114627994 /NCGR_PEP_ID=MMETSP0168-20121206/12587_1 /TAXON_ID=95228 ORGANISM="Vannella sp., Strain DIVA3 517/6/12" /NCGR_SAMPLE_ID=MMETSP0168 /ASSEMBLY_ACC=CAM_ASM_000044 /LENGTH=81 /DNA_ID=CAMNT_0001839353 /DNA_START=257 /DNA_END=502 /DNA_ORIENTATION=+